jgi:hypothetical protein
VVREFVLILKIHLTENIGDAKGAKFLLESFPLRPFAWLSLLDSVMKVF